MSVTTLGLTLLTIKLSLIVGTEEEGSSFTDK